MNEIDQTDIPKALFVTSVQEYCLVFTNDLHLFCIDDIFSLSILSLIMSIIIKFVRNVDLTIHTQAHPLFVPLQLYITCREVFCIPHHYSH